MQETLIINLGTSFPFDSWECLSIPLIIDFPKKYGKTTPNISLIDGAGILLPNCVCPMKKFFKHWLLN